MHLSYILNFMLKDHVFLFLFFKLNLLVEEDNMYMPNSL